MSSEYLKIVFLNDFTQAISTNTHRITPFITDENEIHCSSIKNAEKLTDTNDVKLVYKIALDSKKIKHIFLPGDTIGILPSNDKKEVNQLFARLNLLSEVDKTCELQIQSNTLKKNPTIPKHLPPKSTIRTIFMNHVDIHTPPKKLFLKSLARFTEDPAQKTELEQICSPQGSKDYNQLITTTGKTLLGLLNTFSSCKPPVEVLLENLPPLLPRPYSISSSQATGLEITFFVLVHEDGRKGTCTGWLQNLIETKSAELVAFYFRKPTKFRLGPELSMPLILIATGTGVAPFRGFFQDLEVQEPRSNDVWLLYGCRYKDKDFLFREEIETWGYSGHINRLSVAFSRDGTQKFYVQDNINKYGNIFVDWVLEKGAAIFVCGDLKTVVKDVRKAIVENFVKHGGVDGEKLLNELESSGRFVVDTWI